MDVILGAYPFWLAVAIGAGMLVVALWFQYRLETLRCRNLPAAEKRNYPPAAVVMALKGIDPGLRDNLLAVLGQDHPDLEYVFAVEARSDPAYALVEDVIAEVRASRPELRAQLVVAGIDRTRAQQITNQLAGLAQIRNEVELLVFLDSDIRPSRDYIRYLLVPFDDRAFGATSGYRWYQPDTPSFSGLLCSVWNAGAFPAIAHPTLGFAWGGTMAIRRSVFEDGVRAAWQNAVSNDMTLTRVVRSKGLAIRYVPHCVAITYENPAFEEVLEFTSRQMLIVRVYNPVVWLVLTIVHAQIAGMLLFGLFSLIMWMLVGGDHHLAGTGSLFLLVPFALSTAWMVYIGSKWMSEVTQSLRERLWLYVLLAPLASLLSTRNSIKNLMTRKITWRGIRYELVSPEKTVVIRPD